MRAGTLKRPVLVLVAIPALWGFGTAAAVAQQGGLQGDTLKVALSEWSMGFEKATADKGGLTVQVSNTGSAGHNLTIESETGKHYVETRVLSPGDSRSLQIDLPAGTYEVYCNVPGHRSGGMEATLVVGSATN